MEKKGSSSPTNLTLTKGGVGDEHARKVTLTLIRIHMGAGEYKREAGCSACPRHHEVLAICQCRGPFLSVTVAVYLLPLRPPFGTSFSWLHVSLLRIRASCVRSKHFCRPPHSARLEFTLLSLSLSKITATLVLGFIPQ